MNEKRVINTCGGSYREINNQGLYVEGNYSEQSLPHSEFSKTAHHVRSLLEKVEKNLESTTQANNKQIALKAFDELRHSSNFKNRVLRALKSGTFAAFEEAISHPAASFFIAACQDWKQSRCNSK